MENYTVNQRQSRNSVVQSVLLFLLLIICLVATTATPEVQAVSGSHQERQRLRVGGDSILTIAPDATAATDLVTALDIDPSIVTSSVLEGAAQATNTFPGLGVLAPIRGTTVAVLSTGVAGSTSPEPGDDFSPPGIDGDRATLTINLRLPTGNNRLSFTYYYLSTELPDFKDTIYNDTFRAFITDRNGTREVARASVNSSIFYPTSEASAGGTGFDLFTPDPLGVDFEFPGGLPDAGLTLPETINTTVTEGDVSIQFVIEDLGDGYLDSTVVLDNLLVSTIEAVNPVPDLLTEEGITSNLTALLTGGSKVNGLSADGVTRLVLRSFVPGPGTAEFCLDTGYTAPVDGGLGALNSTDQNQCTRVDAVFIGSGYAAFAQYRAPEDFVRSADALLTYRPLRVRLRFNEGAANSSTAFLPLKIVRPPLLLIHGIWDSSKMWNAFPLRTDSRFRVTEVNYSNSHAASFEENKNVLFQSGIRQAIEKDKSEGIATTQVDVAGHSMGGNLSRVYAALTNYRAARNYYQGSINRLVTMNTPHTGTPLANAAIALRDNPDLRISLPFNIAMSGSNHPISLGAVDNLAVGSAAYSRIPRTEVPSHAIVGIVFNGPAALKSLPTPYGEIYKIIDFFGDTDTLFENIQHDGVVGRRSQEGGLPASSITAMDGLESWHLGVGSSTKYSNRLAELLNASVSSSSFASFPALETVENLSPPTATTVNSAVPLAQGATENLRISDPVEGAIIRPSTNRNVIVEVTDGAPVTRVLVVGPNSAVVDDTAPFAIEMPIPQDAVGSFPIQAFGFDAAGNSYISPVVNLVARPAAQLQHLLILPREVIQFAVGEERTISMLGGYSDGITRTITSAVGVVSIFSSDPSVVTVESNGVLIAQGVGVATVNLCRLNDCSVQDSISARVSPENLRPFAVAGLDQVVLISNTVTLDASQSLDPDAQSNSVLSYEWLQVSGPLVELVNSKAITSTFEAKVEGVYVFSLIVRDAQNDSTPDSVTVQVVKELPLSKIYLPLLRRAVTATTLNDTDTSIKYSAYWGYSKNRKLGNLGDDVHYTATNGSYLEYAFEGVGITVVSEFDPNYGLADIYIDGVLVGTASAVGPTRNDPQRVLFSITTLNPGSHILKVVKKSGAYLVIDGLTVFRS